MVQGPGIGGVTVILAQREHYRVVTSLIHGQGRGRRRFDALLRPSSCGRGTVVARGRYRGVVGRTVHRSRHLVGRSRFGSRTIHRPSVGVRVVVIANRKDHPVVATRIVGQRRLGRCHRIFLGNRSGRAFATIAYGTDIGRVRLPFNGVRHRIYSGKIRTFTRSYRPIIIGSGLIGRIGKHHVLVAPFVVRQGGGRRIPLVLLRGRTRACRTTVGRVEQRDADVVGLALGRRRYRVRVTRYRSADVGAVQRPGIGEGGIIIRYRKDHVVVATRIVGQSRCVRDVRVFRERLLNKGRTTTLARRRYAVVALHTGRVGGGRRNFSTRQGPRVGVHRGAARRHSDVRVRTVDLRHVRIERNRQVRRRYLVLLRGRVRGRRATVFRHKHRSRISFALDRSTNGIGCIRLSTGTLVQVPGIGGVGIINAQRKDDVVVATRVVGQGRGRRRFLIELRRLVRGDGTTVAVGRYRRRIGRAFVGAGDGVLVGAFRTRAADCPSVGIGGIRIRNREDHLVVATRVVRQSRLFGSDFVELRCLVRGDSTTVAVGRYRRRIGRAFVGAGDGVLVGAFRTRAADCPSVGIGGIRIRNREDHFVVATRVVRQCRFFGRDFVELRFGARTCRTTVGRVEQRDADVVGLALGRRRYRVRVTRYRSADVGAVQRPGIGEGGIIIRYRKDHVVVATRIVGQSRCVRDVRVFRERLLNKGRTTTLARRRYAVVALHTGRVGGGRRNFSTRQGPRVGVHRGAARRHSDVRVRTVDLRHVRIERNRQVRRRYLVLLRYAVRGRRTTETGNFDAGRIGRSLNR